MCAKAWRHERPLSTGKAKLVQYRNRRWKRRGKSRRDEARLVSRGALKAKPLFCYIKGREEFKFRERFFCLENATFMTGKTGQRQWDTDRRRMLPGAKLKF